jgi:Protein of unknown function (DUF2510)
VRGKDSDGVDTEAGWYVDATRPNTERYWDGIGWTAQARYPGVAPFDSPVPPTLLDLHSTSPVTTPTPPSTTGFSARPGGISSPFIAPMIERRPVHRRTGKGTAFKAASLATAVVVVAGGAFLIFGRHADADAAVADAVSSALASRTADVTISGSGGTAGANFTLTGTGAIDFDQNALQMSVTVASGSEQITEQAVYLDNVIYLNLGDEIGRVVPGKSWVSLDLGQLSQGSTSLGSASSFGSDPAAALRALSQSGNTATDLGSSTINGVNVEGYSVQIDQATIQKAIAQENVPGWMQQALKSVSDPDVDYKVYVDDAGHLARMTTDVTEKVQSMTFHDSTTMDFTNYGTTVDVSAPPAGEVTSFQSFLQAAAPALSSTTD